MGVDKSYFVRQKRRIDYDLVYCGSIAGRLGLLDELCRLCSIGLKLIVIGEVSGAVVAAFKKYPNIEFAGRLDRQGIAEIYSQSTAGLNYMPDLFPYNQQTSTKLIEYCAARLNIVTSSYCWVDQFQYSTGSKFLRLSELRCRSDFDAFNYVTPCVDHLEWSNLLESVKFDKFIRSVLV
jgi:hypothetical protein